MDATAVCAARALGARNTRERVVLPLMFGAFQAGMAAIGWLGGRAAAEYIAAWDHWIAFALLLGIGVKMLIDALRADPDPPRPGSALLYVGLALATSIDAAA